MPPRQVKRDTDLQIISEWIEPRQRVLDLGCGRGVLIEHLQKTREVYGVGVDTDVAKIEACIKRGVSVYHGDATEILHQFPERFFDWVVLSRTIQEMHKPGELLRASLCVGRNLAVGFVNHGYWLNRIAMARTGTRVANEVFPQSWHDGTPYNPVTVHGFEAFCAAERFRIVHAVYLAGDWRTPITRLPNLRAGYALYHLAAG